MDAPMSSQQKLSKVQLQQKKTDVVLDHKDGKWKVTVEFDGEDILFEGEDFM
jgi:uncharacterized membrane protein YkoI